jgi:hypothetical protein
MSESREYYGLGEGGPEDWQRLSFLLLQISDRLDAVEQIRGSLTVYDRWEAAADTVATLGDLAFEDDDDVEMGNLELNRLQITDENGVVIHQMGA